MELSPPWAHDASLMSSDASILRSLGSETMAAADVPLLASTMQPLYGHHIQARALHVVTFLVVVLFMLVRVERRCAYVYEIIDLDPLVPLVKPMADKMMTAQEASLLRTLAERNNFTQSISWLSRSFTAVQGTPHTRTATEEVDQPFAPSGFRQTRWQDEEDLGRAPPGPLAHALPVAVSAMPARVDASRLLLGISTSYDRLTDDDDSLIRDWQRWLTDGRGSSNGASVVVTLRQASSREAWEMDQKLREVGIDATVVPLNRHQDRTSAYLDMAAILLEVSAALADDGHPDRYLGLVDDDIFFPTPAQLVSSLSAFDTATAHYIGLPSERPDWSVENSTAVTHDDDGGGGGGGGGGVVFLTPPAALIVSHLPCWPYEAPARNYARWDAVLHDCVQDHSDLSLDVLPSSDSPPTDELHSKQPAGTYKPGVAPLALRRRHHLSRHNINPAAAHLVTSVCGEACFLQRFRFRDDWVLVNGHSITQDRGGLDMVPETAAAELRESMPLGREIVLARKEVATPSGAPNVWHFVDAVVAEGGRVWQVYVNREGEAGNDDAIDSVIALAWEAVE